MDQSTRNGLSLHFTSPDVGRPSLQDQIQQVIQERGALRHITIDKLQLEANQSKLVDHNSDEVWPDGNGLSDVDDDDNEEDPQVRRDKLWKVRDEMLQKLAYAQNEVLSALDFVSLLLSGTSTTAQNSMSPALKERVPVGTIKGQTVERQEISTTARQNLTHVSDGWKGESFRSAATHFAEAASRLEGEAQRQNHYWDQVARLKSEGWAISRLPNDSRAIGVHYGFPEAASQFRSRSFALLHQDGSSNLQLDPRSVPDDPTVVRVAIIRNGIETGSSRLSANPKKASYQIGRQIEEARDAIFEQELFHEVAREARLLANQSTRLRPLMVEATLDPKTQIQIIQMSKTELESTAQDQPDDALAESLAARLRLLLLLEHAKSKQRRSRSPEPMVLAPKVTPPYALLRPILTHQRHQASLSTLYAVYEYLASTFRQAGLSFEYDISAGSETSATMDMQRLRQPAQSTFTARLQNNRPITLEIETYLGSPIFGTIYRSADVDYGFVRLQADSFSNFNEAVEYLSHAVTMELIQQTTQFDVLKPHSGEVSIKSLRNVTAIVSVRPQRLVLIVIDSNRVAFSWSPTGYQRSPADSSSEMKSFSEVLQTFT